MSGKFEGIAHVEWETPMVDTLRKRLADHWGHSTEEAEKRVIHFDIQKTSELLNGKWKKNTLLQYGKTNHPETAEGGLKSLVGRRKVDLIIGGPPCQAYSIAGRAQDENSMKNDYRNYLFESFIGVVNEFKPKATTFVLSGRLIISKCLEYNCLFVSSAFFPTCSLLCFLPWTHYHTHTAEIKRYRRERI